jgi:PAS domain S-box-containing protein
MAEPVKGKNRSTGLRCSAEKRLSTSPVPAAFPGSETEVLKLLHELQVHQVELEMQNEELQRSHEELRIALDRYTLLYDFAPLGYFTLGRDLTILSANLAGAELFGRVRSRLLKQKFLHFIAENYRNVVGELLVKVLSSAEKQGCEAALVTPAREKLFVMIEATAVDPEECLVSVVDITDRKLAEEALCRSWEDMGQQVKERTAELAQAMGRERESMGREKDAMIREMDAMGREKDAMGREKDAITGRLQAVEDLRKSELLMIHQGRLAAMGEMLANISHQWRQPLNVIGLLMQQLKMLEDIKGPDRRFIDDNVAKVMGILKQMSQTIEDFQTFSSPGRERTSFRINPVIAKVLGFVEDQFRSHGIMVETGGAGDPEADGFPNEVGQVLLNLLSNARDAIAESKSEDKRIFIRSWTENGRAVVTVADHAGGIPEEIIGSIFDAYFTTKELGQGSGIGLFMSKMIIEKNMGGSLTVRNVGGGAEFRIELGPPGG